MAWRNSPSITEAIHCIHTFWLDLFRICQRSRCLSWADRSDQAYSAMACTHLYRLYSFWMPFRAYDRSTASIWRCGCLWNLLRYRCSIAIHHLTDSMQLLCAMLHILYCCLSPKSSYRLIGTETIEIRWHSIFACTKHIFGDFLHLTEALSGSLYALNNHTSWQVRSTHRFYFHMQCQLNWKKFHHFDKMVPLFRILEIRMKCEWVKLFWSFHSDSVVFGFPIDLMW